MAGEIGNNSQPGSSDPPNNLVTSFHIRPPRRATRMAKLTLRNRGKARILFESRRLIGIGPTKKIIDSYISYLGFLGRKQPSILIKNWKSVPANTKELVWQAILEKFEIFIVAGNMEVEFSQADVKTQKRFRKKWVNFVGRRWQVFKTNLTTNYIYGKKKDTPPYEKDYEYLDKDVWDAFVASRLTEDEKAKRLKAQEIQSHNTCPQRCSRGGYEVLTQKIMAEKYKALQEAASDDPSAIINPPSPPSRHEKWKRARLTPSGEYINQEAKDIAAKIDALEQEASSGTFIPSGSNDILAVATGKPDHPSRVRGVGEGYTVKSYFREKERGVHGMVSREEMATILAQMKAEMQASVREEMKMIMSSQSQPPTPVSVSGRGSCAPEDMGNDDLIPKDLQAEEVGADSCDYELYVEDPHRRLVAFGRVHDFGSTIHHRQMKNDEVRVSVERVVVADALVPLPTDEVTTVGGALKQFVAWPRRLVLETIKHNKVNTTKSDHKCMQEGKPKPKKKTNDDDAAKNLWFAAADFKEAIQLTIEAGIVSSKRTTVYINQVDIMGLLANGKISIPAMQFYNKCLHRVLKSSGRAGRFGLMSPLTVQTHGNNEEDMGLIRERIGEETFDCLLLPFNDKGWELMALCPKRGFIAWFCCTKKGKKKRKIAELMETAFETYQVVVKAVRSKTISKPQWVHPKCCREDDADFDCGLFVMRHMLEIIRLDVVDSFEKVLNMDEPYTSDDFDDVRKRWAECFMDAVSSDI